jgi:fibronectin-binding autotransporter adhesin
MKPRIAKPLQIIALCLASAHLAHADSATWNGTTDATWAELTNWSSDPNPVPGSGNTATFDNAGNANTTIDLGAGVTISSIVFDTADAAAYTIGDGGAGAQDLTLEDSGSIVANSGINASQTFDANLTLGADGSEQSYAVTNSDNNNSITFAGDVSGGTGGIAGAKTLDINNSTGVLFNGIIADGGASSLAIQKSGGGNLTLAGGVSTLTGGIHITAGMLTISGSGSANNSTISLGAAGNTGTAVKIGVVNSGTNPSSPLTVVEQTDGEPTTRILSTSANTSSQWSGAITMNDDLTVGALNTNAANVYSFTLNSGATVDLGSNTLTLQSTSPGNVNANGIISGAGEVVVNNSSTGTATMGAVNTFTGNLDIQSGLLNIGASAAIGADSDTAYPGDISISDANAGGLTNASSIDQTWNGVISGAGPLKKTGSGTLTLGGQNTYSGATSVQKGTLTVASGGSSTGNGALTIGGTLTPAPVMNYNSALTSGFGVIKVGDGNDGTGNATLNQTAGTINGSSLTLNNGHTGLGAGDMNLSGTAILAISGTTTVSNTAAGDNIFSTITVGSGTSFSSANINMTGAPSSGRNAAGRITQDGGSVTTGFLTMARTTSVNSSPRRGEYNLNGGTLTINDKIKQDAGTDTFGTFNFNGGTLKAGVDSTSFMEGLTTASIKDGGAKIDTDGFDITIGQDLVKADGATTDTLTKDGLGTLTLGGTNTYTGATTVNEGMLEVSGSLDATDVEVKSSAALAGTGTLDGNVTVRTGGHLAFDVAASAGSQVPMIIAGSLTLEANTVIDLAAAAPPAVGGPYVLLTATGGISGSLGSTTFSGVSGSVAINGDNLELTVTAPAGFAAWIATPAFGLAVADQDPTDDPDNDGMDNLLEFALNGNPGSSDPSVLPKLVVTATDFEFTYQRRDDSVSPETTQTFQWGTTLATWPGSAVIPATSGAVGAATITVSAGTPDNAVTDTVKISIPKTEAGGSGKLFGRLQVTKP